MTADTNEPVQVRDESPPAPVGSVILRRIVLWVVGMLLVFCGLTAFLGFFDGPGWLRSLALPPLVSAHGSIRMTTGPLAHGQVWTHHADGRTPGSVGFINERGEFALKTDIQGSYVDGAYAGVHKLTLRVPQNLPRMGAVQPPSVVAEQYLSVQTTPLTIEISRDASKNTFDLVVEPNDRLTAPAESGPQAGKRDGGASMAELFALRKRLQSLDADSSGSYSLQELAAGGMDLGAKFSEIDSDGSGAVEESELAALHSALAEKPAGP